MRRKNSLGLFCGSALAAVLILACASALPAQKKKDEDASGRTVQGTVSDTAGNPVQQAVVQLKDTRTLQVLSFITQQDGAYHFAGLRTDTEYQVRAEHDGLSTDWRRISVFDPRKLVTMNLKLEKKDAGEK
jgi:Carboxypeptidase regulatory-like domain